MEGQVLVNYFHTLVNLFFKILPLKESGTETLGTYMESLQMELLGCKAFVKTIRHDASYLTLLSVLQYMIDHPECEVATVRREVFRAIALCKKLEQRYAAEAEGV
jgi:hypothetical protein